MKNSIYTAMKKTVLTTILIAAVTGVFAQQLSSYKIFHLNPYLHNPAVAGSKPYIFVSTAYSQAWSGMEGAPNLQSVSAHALVSQRVGFGGKIFYENSGLSGQFGAEASYAYHIPIGTGGTKLSFGLSALLSQYSLRKDRFVVAHPDDQVIENSENSVIVPDAAFGMSLYQDNKFFLNYGIYQLLGRQVNFINEDNLENRRVRHHFINAAFRITASENLKIEPSVLMKLTESGMFQADLGMKAEIKETLGLGIYYKTGEAVVPYLGIDTKYLVFGYSYGFITGDIKSYSVGSHEIMIILKLNNSKPAL
ncbi:MAG: type IX secretion system membrane protein PorP/SprF [Bacteroidota bacterium]